MSAAIEPVQVSTYATAHTLYRRAGWTGPLPLPAGKKWPPPDGFTGWHGLYPSGADSQVWIDDYPEYRDTRQLALRMPDTVIGIDVDDYGDKHGADTMSEAVKRWGDLPEGPSSSARGDGASGIYLFRVPKGTVLRTQLGFRELGLGHVEIVQRHHRYAVAWPSVHPTEGTPYEWYGCDGLPRVQDIPPLPQGWLDGLAGTDAPGEAAADPKTVADFAKRYNTGEQLGAIRGVLTVFERDSRSGSRHDAMLSAACMAAREARMGRYPAGVVCGKLREAYTLALAEAKPGQRLAGPPESRREFDSMWAWGVSQALAESDAELAARAERQASANPPVAASSETGSDGAADEQELTPEEQHAVHVANRVEALRITAEARAILADEARPPLEALSWSAFLASPQPEYLVPRMLPLDGTTKVFGPPGSTKSFWVLDLALCLATGTPWRGLQLPRTRVHYVMAEGQATNVARTHAWLYHHHVPAAAGEGWFEAIPRGVLLTEQGVTGYLAKVQAENPGWVILDTKNRMMVGNENDASDVGVMVRAMDLIRQVGGGRRNVTLVDHTGLGDTTRGRGSNAVEGAMDTEIRVTCVSGIASAEVTRDKNDEPGHSVSYRLQRIEALARGDRRAPAVVVPNDAAMSLPFGHEHELWNSEVPEEIAQLVNGKDGASVARHIFRLLRHVGSEDGLTSSEIRGAIEEAPSGKVSKSTWQAGFALARKGDIAFSGKSDTRFILGPKWI